MWKLEEGILEDCYAVRETDELVVVIPTTDSRPHDMDSSNCPCKPELAFGEKGAVYEKPMLTHTRYEDLEAVDKAMKAYD